MGLSHSEEEQLSAAIFEMTCGSFYILACMSILICVLCSVYVYVM